MDDHWVSDHSAPHCSRGCPVSSGRSQGIWSLSGGCPVSSGRSLGIWSLSGGCPVSSGRSLGIRSLSGGCPVSSGRPWAQGRRDTSPRAWRCCRAGWARTTCASRAVCTEIGHLFVITEYSYLYQCWGAGQFWVEPERRLEIGWIYPKKVKKLNKYAKP